MIRRIEEVSLDVHLHKTYDQQIWKVDTSRVVASLETN